MDLQYYLPYEPERLHPQVAMKALGIKYERAIPQPFGDQWWFFGCTNVPDPLPPYLSELQLKE